MQTPIAPRERWRLDGRPPRGRTKLVPVLKITPGNPHDLVILSEALYGVWTHFVFDKDFPRGHTVACTGEGRDCHINHTLTSQRWQGWLCVAAPNSKRAPALVTLTFHAAGMCPELYMPGETLRGQVVRLTRLGNSCLAPMSAVMVPDTHHITGMAEAVQIGPQLERMFNAPARKAPSFRQLFAEAARAGKAGAK